MLNGPVLKCHVNTEPSNHLKTKPILGILNVGFLNCRDYSLALALALSKVNNEARNINFLCKNFKN